MIKTSDKVRGPKESTCVGNTFKLDSLGSSLTTEWLSTEEAAAYLRIPVKSLRNLTSNGRIPFYKLYNLNRYRVDELQRLILSNKRGPIYGY